jgi:tetratricopeptide (TPR) repeat protein
MASLDQQDVLTQRFAASIIRGVGGLLGIIPATANHLPDPETYALALHLLDFALDLDDAWPQARELLLRLAPQAEQAGHRDDWRPYLERAIAASPRWHDSLAAGEFAFYLGQLHELRARFVEAQAAFAQSAALFAGLQRPQEEARAIGRSAYIARLQRHFDEAEKLAAQAERLAPNHRPTQAACHLTLGTVAFDRRDWEVAVKHLHQALALWEAEDDKRMVALSLRNLGPALHMQKRYAEAVACYARALALFRETPDPVNQAVTQMNLGIVHSLQGESREALALYAKAEPVLRRVEDSLRLASLLTNQAIEYRNLARWDEAEWCCRQAVVAWETLGNLRSTLNALDALIYILRGQGRLAEAEATLHTALARLQEMESGPARDTLHAMLCLHPSRAHATAVGNERGETPLAKVPPHISD